MLGKLLKYELKSQAKIMFTIIAGILVMGISMTVLFKVNFAAAGYSSIWLAESASMRIFGTITTLFGGVCIIALCAAALATIIILAYRFYKNLFSNEGYLSFTLPVSTNAQLMSKIITSLLWIILIAIALIISVSVFCVFGTAKEEVLVNQKIIDEIHMNFIDTFYNFRTYEIETDVLIEAIILPVLFFILVIISIYLAITIGSIVVSKFKILASTGVFIGITTIFLIMWVLALKFISKNCLYSHLGYLKLELLSAILLSSFWIVICYIFTKKLIDKKLNLP